MHNSSIVVDGRGAVEGSGEVIKPGPGGASLCRANEGDEW